MASAAPLSTPPRAAHINKPAVSETALPTSSQQDPPEAPPSHRGPTTQNLSSALWLARPRGIIAAVKPKGRVHATLPGLVPRPITIRELRPAPPRQDLQNLIPRPGQTSFYKLPAELRIEIYRLVLERIIIHILPDGGSPTRFCPHSLTLTSHQVRNEVLPMIHALCELRVTITDFNFDPLLIWLARIPPDQMANLTKNLNARIALCSTNKTQIYAESLRRYLHMRADPHRPQPNWQYSGPTPKPKVANDLKRRAKRMTEVGKKAELVCMIKALGIPWKDEVAGAKEGEG